MMREIRAKGPYVSSTQNGIEELGRCSTSQVFVQAEVQKSVQLGIVEWGL